MNVKKEWIIKKWESGWDLKNVEKKRKTEESREEIKWKGKRCRVRKMKS